MIWEDGMINSNRTQSNKIIANEIPGNNLLNIFNIYPEWIDLTLIGLIGMIWN